MSAPGPSAAGSNEPTNSVADTAVNSSASEDGGDRYPVPMRHFSRQPVDSPSKSRNIVLLLDGTGKEFCARNSNLIKLHTVLRADDEQLLYYSSGLGELKG